ncbi:AP-3 complex subunit sigma-2 [Columba livia]|uniref:AP-3 complex subunit sigma-2 n=1 Tax=Columba livia TaxID=8932 RepID=A0A2I0LHW9_COLLI|nr:AP-3 complex subunit sigma-2 [Columba livia]
MPALHPPRRHGTAHMSLWGSGSDGEGEKRQREIRKSQSGDSSGPGPTGACSCPPVGGGGPAADHPRDFPPGAEAGRPHLQLPGVRQPVWWLGLQADIPALRHAVFRVLCGLLGE